MPIEDLEHAHAWLGLTYAQLARALRVDESTLHRWRATAPTRQRQSATTRGAVALGRFLELLRRRVAHAVGVRPEGLDPARAAQPAMRHWLERPHPACAGETPRALLLQGELATVMALLERELAGTSDDARAAAPLHSTLPDSGRRPPPPERVTHDGTARPTNAPARSAKLGGPAGPADVLDPARGAPSSDATLRDSTFDCAPVGIVRLSLAGAFLAVNAVFAALLGYAPEALVGRRFQEVTHPDDRANDLDLALQLVGGAIPSYTLQKRYLRADGRAVWGRLSVTLVRDPAGTPAHLLAVIDPLPDIQAAALRLALGQGPDVGAPIEGVWEWDVASGDVYWSPQVATSLGRDPADIAPDFRAFAALVHPDDLPATQRALDDYLAGRTSIYHAEFRMAHRDGTWRWIQSRGRALARDTDGRPVRVAGLHTDVTARREAEEALRQREARLRCLVDATAATLWTASADGQRSWVSDPAAWEAIAGRAAAESPEGNHVFDGLHPDDRAPTCARWEQAIADARPFAARARVRVRAHGDGQDADTAVAGPGFAYRYFAFRAVPLRDTAGAVTEWVGVSEDVEAEERTARALAASEARLRLAIQAGDLGLWEYDFVTDRLWWSAHHYALVGREPGGLSDTRDGFLALVHPDDRAEVERQMAALLAGSVPAYFARARVRLPDGRERRLVTRGLLERATDGRPLRIVGITRDETEAQVAATARWASEARAQHRLAEITALYETAPVALGALDGQLRYTRINARLAAMNGMPPEAHLGRHVREVLPSPVADVVVPLLERVRDTGEPLVDWNVCAPIPGAPGHERHWMVNYYPLRDGAGPVLGVGAVVVELPVESHNVGDAASHAGRVRLRAGTPRRADERGGKPAASRRPSTRDA